MEEVPKIPFNGSGVYTFPGAGGYPYQFNTVIDQGAVNALLGDVQSALNTAATRDGQAVWTGSLNMGNNSITNVKSFAALPAVGQTASSLVFSNANPNTNSGQATFGIDASGVFINSSILGSGTQLPIQLRQAGTPYWAIATTGALSNVAPSSGTALTVAGVSGSNPAQVTINEASVRYVQLTNTNATGGVGLQLLANNSAVNTVITADTGGSMTVGTVSNHPLNLESNGSTRILLAAAGNVTLNAPASGGHSIAGTNTNDNASAGFVGEVITAANSGGSALTTGTNINITSVSLTAGDWDVAGAAEFSFSGNSTFAQAGLSSTSATLPAATFDTFVNTYASTASVNSTFPAPTLRFSLSATTTVFLVGVGNFSTGAGTVFGRITARRRR